MPDGSAVVAFLGLSAEVEAMKGPRGWVFPPGVLYPYTTHLNEVAALFEQISASRPEWSGMLLGERNGARGPLVPLGPEELRSIRQYLKSIRSLHSRICFAGGAADTSLGAAYGRVLESISRATGVSPMELHGSTPR